MKNTRRLRTPILSGSFSYYTSIVVADRTLDLLSNTGERLPPRDWDPLVKQTYSVWVQTENGRRKWHLSTHISLHEVLLST